MSNEQKTAIQQAEKQLETERKERLQKEVYDYLKQELEAIDNIDSQVRKLETEKRAHEENVKNIKQGNLEAIEKRRQNFVWIYPGNSTITVPFYPQWTVTTGTNFYNSNVAGLTVNLDSGKTFIF